MNFRFTVCFLIHPMVIMDFQQFFYTSISTKQSRRFPFQIFFKISRFACCHLPSSNKIDNFRDFICVSRRNFKKSRENWGAKKIRMLHQKIFRPINILSAIVSNGTELFRQFDPIQTSKGVKYQLTFKFR